MEFAWVIYKDEINDINGQSKIYVGCTEKSFQKRYYNQMSSFGLESLRNCTRLASHMWKLKDKNSYYPIVNWKI